MSKRRAIILSVEVEGLSQAATARLYGVSEATVSRLLARYRVEGEAAFEPRSRRPHSSPSRVADVLNETIVNLRVDLAERGLDAGPETIQWPNHPTTCGKVERFHQTLKKWLTAQHPQPATIDQLQLLIDGFVDEYNHRRPHRSLGRTTPAVAYARLPKTGPAGSTAGPHYRIRRDRIDKTGAVSLRRAGRMHHISIGRAHQGTAVILLIDDLNIRVINTNTGELLRALTLNPNRGYQPRFKK